MNNNRVENRVEYSEHIGVMQNEVNSIINKVPEGVFIDATYGYGSHFKNFKKKITILKFRLSQSNQILIIKLYIFKIRASRSNFE